MNESINLVMAFVFVALGCTLALALLEPKFMRWICSRGLGWASSFEAFKANRVEEVQFWDKKLGIDENSKRQLLIGVEEES